MQQLSLGIKMSLYKKSSACENPTAFLFTFEAEIDRDRTITKQVCFERSNGPGRVQRKRSSRDCFQGNFFSCTDIHIIVPRSVDNISIKMSYDFISFIKNP